MNFEHKNKYQILAWSLVFDAIGMIAFIDIIWAPISAYLMTKMYRGKRGRLAGAVSFVEEILPGTDIIPTFTIMWLITYVFSPEENRIVDIK